MADYKKKPAKKPDASRSRKERPDPPAPPPVPAENGVAAAGSATTTGDSAVAVTSLEERLKRLQTGLLEIGRLCLKWGGDGESTNGDIPPRPADEPAQGAAFPSAPVAGAIPLRQFLAGVEDLEPAERLTVVDAASAMLDQVFVHLPLKRAMHAVDPLQRLRLLRQRLAAELRGKLDATSVRAFHDEMIDIFHSLRDLHTNYILPASYQGRTAYLPFLVEKYFEGDPPAPRYIVTKVVPGFTHPTFAPGVTVTHWNGIPIERAVERNAAREAGSNPDARLARGLEALTLRPMALTAPPDEDWVIIGYEADGQELEVRFEWCVMTPTPPAGGADADDATAMTGDFAHVLGYDAATLAVHRARKSLFFPEEIAREQRMAQAVAAVAGDAVAGMADVAANGQDGAAPRHVRYAARFPDMASAQRCVAEAAAVAAAAATAAEPSETTSVFPDFFAFRKVSTPSGVVGYVRISSFMAPDAKVFVAEFVRIAKLLPQDGLIVDVRGNGGGNINAGELLLTVLARGPVECERFHFINTPTTLALCEAHPDLALWAPSIDVAVQTGETYSQGFPLTPLDDAANRPGYRYPGPVVLVVDALCYSTTDMFAAGFQDHEVGPILGTSGRTGAGGANVWSYPRLLGLNGFAELPKGMNFRTAMRRATRVGARAGVPLEDLGVQPQEVHLMTRDDILNGNADLIARAARLLVPDPPPNH